MVQPVESVADIAPQVPVTANGNLFSDTTELLVFKRYDDGTTGSWDIPVEMLDKYQKAYEDVKRYQAGIIEYLRLTGQMVPFPHGEMKPVDVKPADILFLPILPVNKDED